MVGRRNNNLPQKYPSCPNIMLLASAAPHMLSRWVAICMKHSLSTLPLFSSLASTFNSRWPVCLQEAQRISSLNWIPMNQACFPDHDFHCFSEVGQFSWCSSREVRIRVPFFRTFILVGEPSPQKRGEKGHLAGGPSFKLLRSGLLRRKPKTMRSRDLICTESSSEMVSAAPKPPQGPARRICTV